MDYFRTQYEKCYEGDEYYWGLEPAAFLDELVEITSRKPSELKILNYSYIPKSEADAKAHIEMLELYGISDMKAFMTPFYPEIKRKIVDSWKRLFDDSVTLGNEECYGILWEIRKEWVVNIIKK